MNDLGVAVDVVGDRVHLDERSDYSPRHRAEAFIVPLLAKHIDVELEKHCPRGDGLSVLDVGCGRQPFRQVLESRGYKYTGMDAQPSTDGSVEIIGAIDDDSGTQALRGKAFDFILCTEVLEHVADWRRAFSNLSSVMKCGSKMLITCPHFYIPHEDPYDFWRPTLNALKYHSAQEGLETISMTKAGGGFDVLGTLLISSHLNPKSQRVSDRIACKILRLFSKSLLNHLLNGSIPNRVSLDSPFYLSIVAVFTKPSVAALGPQL